MQIGPVTCHQLLCCCLTRSRKLCLRCSSSGYGKPPAVTLPASAPSLPPLLLSLKLPLLSLSPPRCASRRRSDGRNMSVRHSQLFHMPAPWHLSQVTRPVPLQVPQHCSGCPVNSPPILPRALQTGHSSVVAPMHRRHRIGRVYGSTAAQIWGSVTKIANITSCQGICGSDVPWCRALQGLT